MKDVEIFGGDTDERESVDETYNRDLRRRLYKTSVERDLAWAHATHGDDFDEVVTVLEVAVEP